MRDESRIDKFCDELKVLWHKVPDWRFGQFIVNTFGGLTRDPFFYEDDEMLEQLKKYFEKETDRPVMGVYTLSNTGAVLVHDIDHFENKIMASLNSAVPEWYDIEYDEEGNPYFTLEQLRVPLNEVIRIE